MLKVYIKLKSGYTLVLLLQIRAVKNLDLNLNDEVVAIFKWSTVFLQAEITVKSTVLEINLGLMRHTIMNEGR